MDVNITIDAIKNRHLTANLALQNKDLAAYVDCFSDDLQYKQMNGKTVDKKQLANDIERYFFRIKQVSTLFDRLNFMSEDDSFIEEIQQYAKVNIRVFIFFSKQWTIERTATYKWKKINDAWKIFVVEIKNERLK